MIIKHRAKRVDKAHEWVEGTVFDLDYNVYLRTWDPYQEHIVSRESVQPVWPKLEWEEVRKDEMCIAKLNSIVFNIEYVCYYSFGKWTAILCVENFSDYKENYRNTREIMSCCTTLQEVKQAAQEHYETLLTCLLTPNK